MSDKCSNCYGEFPPEILSHMTGTAGTSGLLCGVCALKIRNEYHGIPEGTPFQGKIAHWCWEEATRIKKERKELSGSGGRSQGHS